MGSEGGSLEGLELKPGRAFLAGALAVCLAVLLFAPLAAWLVAHTPVTAPNSSNLAGLAVIASDVHPEPGEKRAYFLSLLFFPVAIPALMWALERRKGWLDAFGRIAAAVVWLSLAGLLLGPNNTCYLRYSWLGLSLPWRLLGGVLLWLGWKYRSARLLGWHGLAVAVTLIGMVLTGFTRENDTYMTHSHFNAVYYSMVQVYQGRILLVDFYNQYGLYPYALLPLFRLIGLDVEKFCLVMGFLTAFTFGCIYYALRRVCVSRSVALVGFLACAFVNYFTMKQMIWLEHIIEYMDPYFQYWPIRLLFPTLMLVLVARSSRPYWPGMLLMAVGCFWNLDSGLPAWGTWVAVQGYREFLRPISRRESLRNAVLHVLKGLACLLLLAGLLQTRLPLAGLVHIHKVFYSLGYFMLPMQPVHTWNLVALLYFAGLAYAFQAARQRRDEQRPQLVFALSILGMGLFSYFQGRSHDWVLFLASWPATLLATLFLDELWESRELAGLARALRVLLTVVLLNFAVSLPTSMASLGTLIQRKLDGQAVLPVSHMLNEEIGLLQKHSEYPRQMVILSNHSSVLHRMTNSQFLVFDSLIEMFRIEEFERLAAAIEARTSPWILVSYEFEYESQQVAWSRLLWTALERNYRCIESSPNKRMRIYAPKPR